MAKELNGKTVTKEFMERATACGNADELMKLAKAEGYELTKDEAEAYMAELADVELGDEVLEKAAGGIYKCPGKGLCPYLCESDFCREPGELVLQNCPTYAPGSPKF